VIRKGTVVFLGASGPVARELQWQKPLKSYCTGTEGSNCTGTESPAVQGLKGPAVQGLRVQLYRD
jgi:hypothetical protein